MTPRSRFTIEPSCVAAITAAVRDHGRQCVETGAYLLACQDGPLHMCVAAVTGTSGVQRSARLLRVSAAANAELYLWAARERFTIVAYVHSHLAGAFLSRTDCEESLNIEGFVSAVVPDFANPHEDPGGWGWWRFLNGGWVEIDAPRVGSLTTDSRIMVFDEEGVREHRDE